ncbi:DNA cytosine methyltransferase, partial [Escherichia coli]|uniref:DNA cytosine methyltransferase n=1 Tax=Escherichia coli TaxID=562 RepID=UPI003EE08851
MNHTQSLYRLLHLQVSCVGVPQNRERIYIVGFNKEKVRNHEHFTFPTPLKTKTRVGDIL